MFWLRFPCEFNVLIRLFVSGVTWSVRASSGKLCCVTSPGKLSSALQSLNSLLRDVTALARSWTSSDGWFRDERPADRRALEGAVAKAGSVASRSSREFRDSRERARTQRVVLNCPGLDIAHRRLVQSERRYGAEPRLHGCSCKALSCDEK